jgi:hypothetical protein
MLFDDYVYPFFPRGARKNRIHLIVKYLAAAGYNSRLARDRIGLAIAPERVG